MVNQLDRLAKRVGLPDWRLQRLLDRYGSMTDELLALAEDDPTSARAARRRRGVPAGRDRVRRQPRGRAAPRRRPRPAYPDLDRDARPRHQGRPGRGAAGRPALGWDEERIANEVQSYADRVEAERRSQEQETTWPPTPPGSRRPTPGPSPSAARSTDGRSPSGPRGPTHGSALTRAALAHLQRDNRVRRRARPRRFAYRRWIGSSTPTTCSAHAPLKAPYDPCARATASTESPVMTAMMSSKLETPGLDSGSYRTSVSESVTARRSCGR